MLCSIAILELNYEGFIKGTVYDNTAVEIMS